MVLYCRIWAAMNRFVSSGTLCLTEGHTPSSATVVVAAKDRWLAICKAQCMDTSVLRIVVCIGIMNAAIFAQDVVPRILSRPLPSPQEIANLESQVLQN